LDIEKAAPFRINILKMKLVCILIIVLAACDAGKVIFENLLFQKNQKYSYLLLSNLF
jgi:hypothetical protein